jgi:cytochrome c-type biogenesis protein CcmE
MTDTLAPREPRRGRRRQRRWLPAVIGIGVVVAVVALVWNLLTGTLYFYNADEAVAERPSLGDDRFTLQGVPVGCSITSGSQGEQVVTAFTVAFNGVLVDVVHRGEPAELFEGGTPVVLDGNWVEGAPAVSGFEPLADDGFHYASDRMRVKHDNDYINDDDYDERLAETESSADDAAAACRP